MTENHTCGANPAAGFGILAGGIIYCIIINQYQKSKGVNISMLFDEIPPE